MGQCQAARNAHGHGLDRRQLLYCTHGHSFAETRDRAGDLQIFSLTLSQLSYRGNDSILVKKQIRIIREMLSILLASQQCRHVKLTHTLLLCAQKNIQIF